MVREVQFAGGFSGPKDGFLIRRWFSCVFFFPYNICAFKNDILKHHTYVVYVCFFFLHQSKQKRNLFVLMVFDSGEVSVFLQGYRPLLVLMGNSLMWLHTLLNYMNEFLNAFLHCKHC